MATAQVESFEVAEVASASPDEQECALALVNKLGLVKQRDLYDPAKQKAPPFREFTKQEHFVYKLLFPMTTSLVEYAREPIPLRVLEIAERATESGMFVRLVVWHEKDVKLDPILVGVAESVQGTPTHTWKLERPYLLARWGAALEDWQVLATRARDKAVAQLESVRAKASAFIERAKVCPLDDFSANFSADIYESSSFS